MDKIAYDIKFFNKLSKICYNQLKKLPKTGKPKANEWTVLSCIVKEDTNTSTLEVIALGTGSKCIGIDKMSNNGDVLNDSHAEIICRRSFMKFLYNEMLLTIKDNKTIFNFDRNIKKFILLNNIRFHFYTTHVPCGDAAIFLKDTCNDDVGCSITSLEINHQPKRLKIDSSDINRTGAKCLTNSEIQDLHEEGLNYHKLGLVRTKPGRGSPTLSVSCSDKIAKWCHIGIQGALLSILLEKPIYFKTFVIAKDAPFCKAALDRALYSRLNKFMLKLPYCMKKVIIGQASDNSFEYQKQTSKQPSSCSISWNKLMANKVEIAVNGRKQGVTKKNLNTPVGRLAICKRELMADFLNIAKEIDVNSTSNYYQLKQSAILYQEMWISLKNYGFTVWPKKEDGLLNFTI